MRSAADTSFNTENAEDSLAVSLKDHDENSIVDTNEYNQRSISKRTTIKDRSRSRSENKSKNKNRSKTMKYHSMKYSKKHYNSNDGMLTTVWGPSMWHFLHTMSFNYPIHPSKEEKQYYRTFILKLQYILPCGKCRTNLKKNFAKLPLLERHMKNRHTFSKYIYDLHELINTMLKKKSGLSYANVRDRYEHFRARCVLPLETKPKVQEMSTKKSENGCTEPIYGKKSKCVLQILPQDAKCETFQMSETIYRDGTSQKTDRE